MRCNLKCLFDSGRDGLLVMEKSPKENKEVRQQSERIIRFDSRIYIITYFNRAEK